MQPVIVVHYHEIALKGKNRNRFEHQLIENIRWALRDVEGMQVRRMSGRVVVRGEELQTPEVRLRIRERLSRVFGVANMGLGFEVRQERDGLAEDVARIVTGPTAERNPRSFSVRVKRSNKDYPETSAELERRLGAVVQGATGFSVDLEHPDLTVFVEIVERTAFVFMEKVPGPGGLPVGVSGNVLALLSSGFDSPVASWMMMKRGCHVDFVHFHSYPYTSDASIRNVEEIVHALARWQGNAELLTVPLIEFQKVVMTEAPAALRVLLYRRCMVRIADALAARVRAEVLVTGESVGQVASQTIPNIAVVDAIAEHPILRPLIGFDKQEIIERAEQIGTAPISQRPYDDCCSLFTPDHPATAARPADLDGVEQQLDAPAWVERLLAQVERHDIL